MLMKVDAESEDDSTWLLNWYCFNLLPRYCEIAINIVLPMKIQYPYIMDPNVGMVSHADTILTDDWVMFDSV